ncbi:nucleic-acid-binding protein from transposon X-element [Trichonephila clavipes]|nr:nucleic-acid-binding protein from transposon X-element [Trichonephila clavipes]
MSPTPPDKIVTKNHKQIEVITSNKFDALQTPQTQENEDVTGTTAENHNVVRPPPPITIDNVRQSHQLLKKLQDITKQKIRGKIIGKGLRVYPENPEAYHTIRRYVDAEKLESFTYQLDEEKDLKAVIRGMPSDTPPQEIIDDLRTYGITVNVCHAMTNRRTGMPMPLFLVTLPRSDINRNIFNLTDLCYLKIVVEPPCNPKLDRPSATDVRVFTIRQNFVQEIRSASNAVSPTLPRTAQNPPILMQLAATARETTLQILQAAPAIL